MEQLLSVRLDLLRRRSESPACSRIQTLEIRDGSGNTTATNDDWKEARQI
jgi:hypothetical protein